MRQRSGKRIEMTQDHKAMYIVTRNSSKDAMARADLTERQGAMLAQVLTVQYVNQTRSKLCTMQIAIYSPVSIRV